MPKPKPSNKMNTAELAAVTAQYDKAWRGLGLPGKPLTPAQWNLHRRASARAKAGRAKIGAGARIVPVSIERGLLHQADAFPRRHALKRSQLVAQGLRLVTQRRPG